MVLIAPLTTKYRKSQKNYYIELKNYQKYGIKPCNIVLNQVKLVDKKRFKGKMTDKKASIEFVNYTLNKGAELIF